MDSKKIRALLLVIEKGSITSAAEELGYTQPGLTSMMNAVEDELGLELLVRSKNGVRLSRDGFELLPSLKRFIAADDELTGYSQRLVEKNSSTLRVGAFSSAAHHWLPEMLSRFRQLNIGTDTAISASNIAAAYEAVRNSTVDVAIVSHQADMMKGLAWFPLHSDKLVAVLPRDYVSYEDYFPIEAFDEEIFLMPSGGFELNILPALCAEGHTSRAIIRYTNLDDASIVSMVAHRLGFTVLSELVMQGIHENVTVLPLMPSASREMGIVALESRVSDKNITKFIEVARQTVKSLYGGSD